MAFFFCGFLGLVFPGFQTPPPPKKEIQSSAFQSNFAFLNPKCFHADFLLGGETRLSDRSFLFLSAHLRVMDVRAATSDCSRAWRTRTNFLTPDVPTSPEGHKHRVTTLSSSLMGSVAKGFFLRKVCGNSAESSRIFAKQQCVLSHQERVRKFCGKLWKFCGN